jgi:hypothetical protein
MYAYRCNGGTIEVVLAKEGLSLYEVTCVVHSHVDGRLSFRLISNEIKREAGMGGIVFRLNGREATITK